MRFSLCSFCKYRHHQQPTCDAYPERIPQKFLGSQERHVEPAEGDHGIQFEIREGLPESSRTVALQIVSDYKKPSEAT